MISMSRACALNALGRRISITLLSTFLWACNGGSSGSDNPPVVSAAPPPDYTAAFRLARQATFGPDLETVERIQALGFEGWVDAQLAMVSAYDADDDDHLTHLQSLEAMSVALEPETDWYPLELSDRAGMPVFSGAASHYELDYQNSVWFANALDAPDQLRQRVAYALSQIMVVSHGEPPLDRRAEALAHYYDILARNAFGNFRTLLGEVARSPAMGIYLSHQGNQKAKPERNTLPDENFARELMQLFTIGLYELNSDGTPRIDGEGNLIPTYRQVDIEELARVMTGWDLQFNSSYGRVGDVEGSLVHPMEFNPDEHDFGAKQLVGRTIPMQAQNGADLNYALDILFEHPNTPPFIVRHLIQRLVTSNPAPDYVQRVVQVFQDNGAGERGDLAATVRAILLDESARDSHLAQQDFAGKAQEPLLALTGVLRAFAVEPLAGWYNDRVEAGVVPEAAYYYFRSDHGWPLGQAALRSPSVFNFYSPDFVPQDEYYNEGVSGAPLVLPEMQLRTPANIAGFQTLLLPDRYLLERHHILQRYGSLQDFVDDEGQRWIGTRMLALVDYGELLEVFERALEGDVDGDYLAMNDTTLDDNGDTPKRAAIKAALTQLERLLLGGSQISQDMRASLVQHLDEGMYYNNGALETVEQAHRVIAGMVQYVALSSNYLAQQ